MPFEPDVQDVHIDQLLTDISIASLNDPEDYVGTKVFPALTVNKQTNLIPIYDMDAWLADEAKPRSPATESEGSGWTVDNTRYACENFAFHKDVPVEVRANADSPFRIDEEAAMYVVDRMLMKMEVKFGADFFKASVWSGNKDLAGSGNKKWSDTTSPLFVDIEDAKISMGDKIVKEPNIAVISRNVWKAWKLHPNLLDRMKTTSDKFVTLDLAARAFELDRILMAKALKKTNKEGQTLTKARILTSGCLLLYVTPRPALMTPTAGYTFYWTALGPGVPVYIRRLPMPLKQADRIEGHIFYDSKVTAADAGYFFDNAAV